MKTKIKTRNDAPVRHYEYYELQCACATRWSRVCQFDVTTDTEAAKLAKAKIEEERAYHKNLLTFVNLPEPTGYRLVKIVKHCVNIELN